MRKFIVVVILLLVAVPALAVPFLPLLIPAWVYAPAAALAITGAASGLYYGLNSGAFPYVDVSAGLKRASSAIYATMDNGSPILSTIALDANLTYSALTAMVNAKPTVYPSLKASFTTTDGASPSSSSTIGAYYQTPNGARQVTSKESSDFNYYEYAPGAYWFGTYPSQTVCRFYSGAVAGQPDRSTHLDSVFFNGGAVAQPPRTRSVPELTLAYTGVAVSAGQPRASISPYAAEMDKAFQDPDYIPAFTSTTTGLPWSPPATVLTPEQLAAHNAAGLAGQQSDVLKAQLAAQLVAATDAHNYALVRLAGAEAVLAADPTNPALIAERDKIKALAGISGVALQDVKTKAETQTGVELTEAARDAAAAAAVATTIPAKPVRKTISMAPILALNGVLATTYPFNLPSAITTYFSAFSGEGAAPVFDLPLPLGQVIHADLSILDPVATLIRYMIGIVVTCGIFFYIVHFFRGIS